MNLLPEQRQAIETLDKNICVSAGAGSGKTMVLTERYLHILRTERARNSQFSVDNILALTFSEEAANEMKERITRGLEKSGLSELIPDLERAALSTIHGFCHRLLRENALEAGLDPDFQVLDETEARFLLNQSIM